MNLPPLLPTICRATSGWPPPTFNLGQMEKARAEVAEVLRLDPHWTVRKFELLGPFKLPEDGDFFGGMLKAGLPEG